MSRKPRSQWTDAYRRRIESAERRGLSKQEGRGHGTPAREGGTSEYQERMARKAYRLFNATATPQVRRRPSDTPVPTYAEIDELISEHGPKAVVDLGTRRREIQRKYERAEYGYTGDWEAMNEDYGDWDIEPGFFFYH